KGDGAVFEAHDTAVGDGDPEDIRGKVGEGGLAVVIGLTMDIPGNSPDLGIDVLQEIGLAHGVFEERTVDGGEGFDGDKEVGSGGAPSRAVLGEAPAWDDVVDMRVVLELPAPGMQDTGEPREIGPDESRIFGQPLESRGRGLKQGLVREALMRADERTQGFRDREGEEEVRPWELLIQVML